MDTKKPFSDEWYAWMKGKPDGAAVPSDAAAYPRITEAHIGIIMGCHPTIGTDELAKAYRAKQIINCWRIRSSYAHFFQARAALHAQHGKPHRDSHGCASESQGPDAQTMGATAFEGRFSVRGRFDPAVGMIFEASDEEQKAIQSGLRPVRLHCEAQWLMMFTRAKLCVAASVDCHGTVQLHQIAANADDQWRLHLAVRQWINLTLTGDWSHAQLHHTRHADVVAQERETANRRYIERLEVALSQLIPMVYTNDELELCNVGNLEFTRAASPADDRSIWKPTKSLESH